MCNWHLGRQQVALLDCMTQGLTETAHGLMVTMQEALTKLERLQGAEPAYTVNAEINAKLEK